MTSCNKEIQPTEFKSGFWRGEITIQNQQLPFVFEVKNENNQYRINLHDGDNIIELDEVQVVNDSVFFTMHIFDIDVAAKIEGNSLAGTYTKNYAQDYVLPFKANFGKKERLDQPQTSDAFNGKWSFQFDTDDENNKKVAIFNSEENKLKGTILSKTGDYRFLEGIATDNDFTLYAFDGNHMYIFKAQLDDPISLSGEYWSGKTGNKKFKATRDENASLPDANSLTYLKEGFDKIEFTFPDLDGNPVSLNDEKYQNKVVVLQLFGTWCPNCMDETIFLTEWYNKNKNRGIEIIGLAYEVKDDFDYASNRVKVMKEKYNVGYDYVVAGTSSKSDAAKTLPMLNHVMSFPTSIVIDKKGNVRNIHTGFSGPATGDYYLDFINEFNTLIDELLAE
ncbi:hypothetical protein KH5_03500 [Urechidicola sp. KH5]